MKNFRAADKSHAGGDQGRANRFLIGGGVVPNLGPFPSQGPLQKNFPESKNFSRKILATGGGGGGGGGGGWSTIFFSEEKNFWKSF